MAYEEAVSIVNTIQRQAADLVRTIVRGLADNRVSTFEGIQFALKGAGLAAAAQAVAQEADAATRQDILYVLEHGSWVLPGEPT